MAIYKFDNNQLEKVQTTTFSSAGILERQHLQAALKHQIDVVAPNCLVISEEFSEWTDSQRRIDLLAIDKKANLVVIELKRTETGEHMELQAIRYAAMVSTLTFKRTVEIYEKHLTASGSEDNAEDRLLEFLGWGDAKEEEFALDTRLILVSADFSKELTSSVMWLNDRDLDIRCIRLIPYKHQNEILIDVQQIIPLPEAESYQVKIKQQTEERREARKSNRDYTRYLFNGEVYNKRKLVLAVILDWFSKNKPDSLDELLKAFPQEIRRGGVFFQVDEAKEIANRQGIDRHFLGEQEILHFSDLSSCVVSNQWGVDNIQNFINAAIILGYEIGVSD